MPALLGSVILLLGAVAAFVLSAPKPDYGAMVEQAARLLEREQYTDALTYLNSTVRPYAAEGAGMPAADRQQFFVLRARALAMTQKIHGVDRPENHQKVVNEYASAEAAGAELEPADGYRMAMAYIALGKLDKALERAQLLPKEERVRRAEVLKRLVEIKFESPAPDPASTLALIETFLGTDPTASDRAWGLARQAELLIRQGYAQKAINRVLASMPRVIDADAERQGELYLVLARAHVEAREPEAATRHLERAAKLLPEGDPRRGQTLMLLARIEAGRGDLEAARQRYAGVLEQFGGEDSVRLPALLGVGEVESAIGDVAGSLGHFTSLVEALAAGKSHPETTVDVVTRSLLDRVTDRAAQEDFEGALGYGRLAERLYPEGAAPPEVLLSVARAHRRAAEAVLRVAGEGPLRLLDLSHLDIETRERARAELVWAADHFRRHAAAVVEKDNEAFGNSLWLAADSFDRAGDQSEAIALYLEFASGFPGDPRRDEARFRLAQAYEARGDYEMAAGQYRGLIADAESAGGGPFADSSYVPLARALLSNGDDADDEDARRLLDAVVEGRVGGSETPGYRDALVLLAAMDSRLERHASAIERLEEALARFPDQRHSAGLLFDLAEAHRRDAAGIARTLGEEIPAPDRRALEETRDERLRRGRSLYAEVREGLSGLDARRLTDADALRLRNACFYEADCAFELKEYETAIRLYDAARERYPRDAASLVAMIQIVSAYVEEGDLKRAVTANERARRFYESLPEEVWSDPNLPIGREHFERWLDSLAVLGGGATAGAGEGSEPPRR